MTKLLGAVDLSEARVKQREVTATGHLSSWLFDQGLNPISRVLGRGRPDLEELSGAAPFVLEAKIVNDKTGPRSQKAFDAAAARWISQAISYADAHGLATVAVVVFNRTKSRPIIAEDVPEPVAGGRLRLHLVTIRATEVTASRLKGAPLRFRYTPDVAVASAGPQSEKMRTTRGNGSSSANGHSPLLEELGVKRFKSLLDVTVPLAQVNVFVGANAAGKSNLLEALGVLGAAASGRVDDQALLRRGVRPGVPRLFRSSFRREPNYKQIQLIANSQGGAHFTTSVSNAGDPPKPWWAFRHEVLEQNGKQVASRSPAGCRLGKRQVRLETHTSIAGLVRGDASSPAPARQLLELLDDFAIFAPVTPVLRGITQDTAPRAPVGLYGGQLPEAISTLLSTARKKERRRFEELALEFIDWADKLEVTEPSRTFLSPSVPTLREVVTFKDRFMHPRRNVLSGYDASEGALHILFALVLALHPLSPRCFAIDNFEQGLNPRLARSLTSLFVRAILEGGRQVLLTSHNPLVLDGLPLQDERVRMFAVERDAAGHTKVRQIPVRDVTRLQEKHGELPLSRLWVTGRLGGVPNV